MSKKPTSHKKSAGADLQARIDELTNDLQRLQAEFINYKRREAESRGELLAMAKGHVVMEILPVLDNIERALSHRPEELRDNAWAGGVEQIGKQALATLSKMGVEKIQAVGQPFDHNLHEAVATEEGEGSTEVVVAELQSGYTLGGQVIRHAMVKVGRPSEGQTNIQANEEGEQ